ncbi:HNH endonuclease [Mycobacteroides abscessus]|uniref:HNH endonuclease n=1 Tax=Mycobacteroides abscessus TaxID=36809 RepID=UPI003B3B32D2
MFRSSTSLPQGRARCQECRHKARDRVAERKALPPEWNCVICGALVRGVSNKSRPGKYCPEHRRNYDNAKGHRRRARRYGVHYEYINPRTIFVRDKWKCGLCGKRVNRNLSYPDPMSASIDHMIPISAGGPHAPANVQCSHLACNIAKGAAGQGEQLALVG